MDDLKNDLKNELQNDLKAVSSPKDWLSFDKMIAPIIIKILFWIGSVAFIIYGIVIIINSLGRHGSVAIFFGGLLTMILGPIMVRVWCEILIVIFKIHDSLVDMKNK
jgi:hypothetical protein